MKYKVGKPHYKLSFIYSFIIIFWAVFLIIYSPFSGMNICGFMLIFLIIFIFLPSMAFCNNIWEVDEHYLKYTFYDNVVEKSDRTPWYEGPALLEFLETVHIGNDHNLNDFRYPVQYVLRPNLDFRGFCGKVASGVIRKGDEVVALPSGKRSHVKSIVTYDGELDYAFPPMSVTLTLEDEIDVSRGEMLVHPDNMPLIGRNFEAMLVWMDEEKMDMEKSFFLKQTTNTSRTRIDSIKYKVDINTMEHLSVENGRLSKEDVPMQLNQIAHVVLTSSKELFFDPYTKNKATGAFILIDPITNNTSAVGMIINQVADKDMHNQMELPVLNLPKLGIAPEHYDAIKRAVKELERQGIAIELKV